MSLAPIVIFAYKRLAPLRKLIQQLSQNPEWAASEIYIYIDAPKHAEEAPLVESVVSFVESIEHSRKHVRPAASPKGLARSIIEGVSSILESQDRVIVLEDDLECTPDFLAFMNAALEEYKEDEQVFSLSGYTPPISIPGSYPHDVYLLPRTSTWGWGIWRNRWKSIDWEVKDFNSFWKDRQARKMFAQGGEDLPYMLYKQLTGIIDTWDASFCYALYRQGKYCLYPRYSKCRHVYTKHSTHFRLYSRQFKTELSAHPVKLPDELPPPDARILRAFARYHRLTPWRRLLNRLRYG